MYHQKHSSETAARMSAHRLSRSTGLSLSYGIAVVDDEHPVRVSLRHIVNSMDGFHCCGEYSSGEAAISGIPGSETRAVFMDLRMPGMCGLMCTRRLLNLVPRLRIVIATACIDPTIIRACYRAGARHHLIKPFSLASCRAAIYRFCAPYLVRPDPPYIRQFPKTHAMPNRQRLTAEEHTVMECMTSGMTYQMIEDHMGITRARLKHLQHRIFTKLGAANQAQAAKAWLLLRWRQGMSPWDVDVGS